jgi:hypothetical protein
MKICLLVLMLFHEHRQKHEHNKHLMDMKFLRNNEKKEEGEQY